MSDMNAIEDNRKRKGTNNVSTKIENSKRVRYLTINFSNYYHYSFVPATGENESSSSGFGRPTP